MKIFFLAFILCTQTVNAQTDGNKFALPTVLSPAPQSAALGRYGDIPISVNTGIPNISVPIFTIASGSLSVPISISYHGSGIKVMDQASPVGLGWALNYGGDLSRVVQGRSDDGAYGFLNTRFPDPNDPSFSAKEKCLSSNICNDAVNGTIAYDGQPDLFYYNVGQRSGQFVAKNKQSSLQPDAFMTIPYSPIKITNLGGYNDFKITDIDGTQYFFHKYDLSTATSSTNPIAPSYGTGWHLTKILSVDQKDSIVYQYNKSRILGYSINNPAPPQLDYDSYGYPTNYSTGTPSGSTVSTTEYLVTEIYFNNGKVTVDYDNSNSLGVLHLFNYVNGTYNEIKKFTLFHSQFINPNGLGTGGPRLDSLQEMGMYNNSSSTTLPSHKFAYYSYGGYQCPPFNTNAQDFWGYFNGKITNADMYFVTLGTYNDPSTGKTLAKAYSAASKRVPDSSYLKIGTLASIQYPTGGVTSFDFEPNQTAQQFVKLDTMHNIKSLGASISDSWSLPNDASSFSYTFTVAEDYEPVNGNLTNAQLVYTFRKNSALSGYTTIDNTATNIELDQIVGGVNNVVLQTSYGSLSEQPNPLNITIQKGYTYRLSFTRHPVLPNDKAQFLYTFNAWINAQTKDSIVVTSTPYTQTVLTGGLRIRGIASSDGMGHRWVKQYKYTGSYYNSPLFSGDFDQLALNSYVFPGWGTRSAYTGTSNYYGIQRLTYSSNLNLPIGSVSNNSISYSEVEEYESNGDGNYNGKTVYGYNKMAQDIVTMRMPFFKISNEGQRSLLTSKKTYKTVNGNYTLVQSIGNNYVDLNAQNPNADTVVFYTAHALINSSYINGSPGAAPSTPALGCLGCSMFGAGSMFLTNRYYYFSPNWVLQSDTTSNFDSKGNKVSAVVSYGYQNLLHSFPTSINGIDSKGQTKNTNTKYVLDVAPPSICGNTCGNALNTQLNAIKSAYYNRFQYDYNGFSLYQGIQNENGVIIINPNAWNSYPSILRYPDSVIFYQNKYQQDITNYQTAVDQAFSSNNACVGNYNSCVANYYTTAPAWEKAVLDMQAQNNITPHMADSTYINNVLVSHKSNNYQTFLPGLTKLSEIRFSTWQSTMESRIMFNRYDNRGNIQEQQKAGDVKEVYLWGYNSQYPVVKVVGSSYEVVSQKLSQPAVDAATNTANNDAGVRNLLDGLRQAFKDNKDVQVWTYTYKPLVGMTSETDPKGFTTYYEYDGFGRLMHAKDKDGLILKKYDYHYGNQ